MGGRGQREAPVTVKVDLHHMVDELDYDVARQPLQAPGVPRPIIAAEPPLSAHSTVVLRERRIVSPFRFVASDATRNHHP
jgi:hypothetical protein